MASRSSSSPGDGGTGPARAYSLPRGLEPQPSPARRASSGDAASSAFRSSLQSSSAVLEELETSLQEKLNSETDDSQMMALGALGAALAAIRCSMVEMENSTGPQITLATSRVAALKEILQTASDALAHVAGSRTRGARDSTAPPPPKARQTPAKQMLIKFAAEEGNYVIALDSLVNSYAPALLQEEAINAQDVKTLFSQCNELYELHAGLLEELKCCLKRWPEAELGATMTARLEEFNVYQKFVLNAPEASQALERLSNNKAYQSIVKQLERKEGNPKDLLQRPLRRVEEIVFTLDGFYRSLPPASPERSVVEDVRDSLQDLLDTMEQRESVAGNLEKVMEIGLSIVGLEENIVRPDRRFIFEGPMKLTLGGQKKPLADYGFLFNDVLFFCNCSNKTYTYVDRVYMHTVSIVDQEAKGSFELVAGEDKYLVTSPEKADWLLYLGKVIREVERTRKVFGVPLKVLMKREKESDIPAIVEKAIKFVYDYGLQKEGIFRQTGRSTQINKLKDSMNQGAKVFFSENMDVHSVAVLFKVWLRELPEPLLTWEGYARFLAAQAMEDQSERVNAMKEAVRQLPRANRFVVQHLCKCLLAVCANEKTKMNPTNISTVFAPNVLKSADEDSLPFDPSVFERVNGTFATLLEHYDEIFSSVENERKRKLESKLKRQLEDKGKEKASRRQARAGSAKDDGQKVKEGALYVLEKKKWVQRWVVLKYNSVLVHKSAKGDKKVKVAATLKNAQVSTAPASTRSFSFQVQGQGAELVFSAKSSDEQDEWLAAMRKCTP